MREFSFRAWDIEARKMIYPPSSIESRMGDFMTMDGRFYFPVNDPSIPAPIVGYKYRDRILMTWTGLLDKNGRKVYEGDILGGQLEGSHIGYCQTSKSLELKEFDYCYACEGDIHWYEIVEEDGNLEVIGNIYQNPELCNDYQG